MAAVLILFFSGCSALGGKKVPEGTIATGFLKHEIAKLIDAQQEARLPGCDYQIIDTRTTGWNEVSVMEEWVTVGCDMVTVYSVVMTPAGNGGTDFSVRVIEPDE